MEHKNELLSRDVYTVLHSLGPFIQRCFYKQDKNHWSVVQVISLSEEQLTMRNKLL